MYNQRTVQTVEGTMDFDTGTFTTVDGKRWVSTGYLDYGNNNCAEIMVLEAKPTEFDQFPVFIANHDDDFWTLGEPLVEFIKRECEGDAHHLPNILIQIGLALYK